MRPIHESGSTSHRAKAQKHSSHAGDVRHCNGGIARAPLLGGDLFGDTFQRILEEDVTRRDNFRKTTVPVNPPSNRRVSELLFVPPDKTVPGGGVEALAGAITPGRRAHVQERGQGHLGVPSQAGPVEAAAGGRVPFPGVGDYPTHTPHLLASAPTVGGRLRMFVDAWNQITHDRWIRSTLKWGYRLEFSGPPPLPQSRVRTTPVPRDLARANALANEVHLLRQKGAIEPLRDGERARFSAHFFLAPKKNGQWRPILNLKPLNAFVRPPRFRMETLAVILPQLRTGDWVTSINLTDAYLHVPVHQDDRQLLCFRYDGVTYQFS